YLSSSINPIINAPVHIQGGQALVSALKDVEISNWDFLYCFLRWEQSPETAERTSIPCSYRIIVWIGEIDRQSMPPLGRVPINPCAHLSSWRLPIIFNAQENEIHQNQTGFYFWTNVTRISQIGTFQFNMEAAD